MKLLCDSQMPRHLMELLDKESVSRHRKGQWVKMACMTIRVGVGSSAGVCTSKVNSHGGPPLGIGDAGSSGGEGSGLLLYLLKKLCH